MAAEQQERGPPGSYAAESDKTAEQIGTSVVSAGVASAKELGGQVGEIASDATTKRYGVSAGRGSNREKGLTIKRANLICSSEQLEEQDAEYNQRRKAAMSSSEGQPCPICLDDMSDDGGGRALVCGHRVHRKCWDAMLSAQAKDSSADAPTPHCPVCRAWQGGESTADTSSKRWYEQSSEELVTGLLGFMFQSRTVEETGFDGAMAARARSP